MKAGTGIAAGQVVGEIAGVVTRAAATMSVGVFAIGAGASVGAVAGKVDKRSEEPAEEGRLHTDHLWPGVQLQGHTVHSENLGQKCLGIRFRVGVFAGWRCCTGLEYQWAVGILVDHNCRSCSSSCDAGSLSSVSPAANGRRS